MRSRAFVNRIASVNRVHIPRSISLVFVPRRGENCYYFPIFFLSLPPPPTNFQNFPVVKCQWSKSHVEYHRSKSKNFLINDYYCSSIFSNFHSNDQFQTGEIFLNVPTIITIAANHSSRPSNLPSQATEAWNRKRSIELASDLNRESYSTGYS